MLRIRLSRGGRVHLPMYNIVVIEQSFKRDGKFVEKIGYYQPTLKNTDPFRLNLNAEAFKKWVNVGAQPSEKVVKLASQLGIVEKKEVSNRPKKSTPKKKAQERAKEKASKTLVEG
ncbi:30S ribosomal protein S16 [Alphaproteobacteria bacterium endosymbiont of Tiliacea citrago]|uniref:30S ribosomal protein S16 n=1 Tax=Alphaproteobacteria bacterium endosymbiont of Tiliacea citrago TaxID=3077944 RepID=UPI00313D245D